MKKIQLCALRLDNFKGQAHLALAFDGKNANIYGDNAAGKTTVYDALTWLLFGKDSRGQSTFELKPLHTDGTVRDHAAITAVTAVFAVDAERMELRRTFYEKWSAKRGSAEKEFEGNSSDYFMDGVPSKKHEFDRRVGELVSEDTFRLLTGVTYFCADLDWRSRRDVLFDVCGVRSDREIMEQEPRFRPLLEACGRLSTEDYKKKLLAERKGLTGIRNDVPVRLDECKKTLEELEGIDFPALHTQREARVAEHKRLSAELLSLEHNALLDGKRNEANALRNQVDKLCNDNAAFRAGQRVPAREDGAALRRELDSLARDASRTRARADAEQAEETRCEAEVQTCRERWMGGNARAFQGEACPICGRPMTGTMLEEARQAFERQKQIELAGIVAESETYKQRAARSAAEHQNAVAELAALEERAVEIRGLLAEIKPLAQPELMDMPDFAAQYERLTAQVAGVNAELVKLSGETAAVKEDLRAKCSVLFGEIEAIGGTISKESLLDFTNERLQKLQEDAQHAAQQMERLDQLLFLCEEFTRFKVQFIEEDVNRRFRLARFRLFTEQINGGLAECCSVMYDGVPYGSLNNGARINLGMDVIATLSEHYGVSVPLFIDNAESVTRLCEIDTQVIRLVVSEQDKELRSSYEN